MRKSIFLVSIVTVLEFNVINLYCLLHLMFHMLINEHLFIAVAKLSSRICL